MNTAKLFFGNAYLTIPSTFKFTGWLGGLLLFVSIGCINCYTMLLNLRVADLHPNVPSYSELSRRVFGKTGKIIVDVSIWIMQVCCCISYLYFIAEQLQQMIEGNNDSSNAVYILLLTIPAMPICWIDTYTYLSYFSMAGISVALIGMGCIFGYCFEKMASHEATTTHATIFDIEGILGHIGVAMFVFEGNAVIMNVRAETRNKQKYPYVLKMAIVTTLSLFMVFAMVCYFAYRE